MGRDPSQTPRVIRDPERSRVVAGVPVTIREHLNEWGGLSLAVYCGEERHLMGEVRISGRKGAYIYTLHVWEEVSVPGQSPALAPTLEIPLIGKRLEGRALGLLVEAYQSRDTRDPEYRTWREAWLEGIRDAAEDSGPPEPAVAGLGYSRIREQLQDNTRPRVRPRVFA